MSFVSFADISESRRSVRGVATLDNQLFVVSLRSSTVCVVDLTSFSQQHIELKGLLRNPRDIATCDVTRRVYIADSYYRKHCVWSIDWPRPAAAAAVGDSQTMTSSPAANKFIDCEGYEPWTLSVATGSDGRRQLLVTSYDARNNSLYVYDVEGKLLRRVQLQLPSTGNFKIYHAVQWTAAADNTTTYVVCSCEEGRQNAEVCRLICLFVVDVELMYSSSTVDGLH